MNEQRCFTPFIKEILAQHKVAAVLCLDQELQGGPRTDRGLDCIRVVHLKDGLNERAVFKQAVEALDELVQGHGRVVVHCRAGRSRSVAVAAAYLMKAQQMEADVALEFVKAKRPSALAPELILLVEEFQP